MSTIPQWFVQQWDTAVRTEVSQKESRLMSAVTDRGTISGEAFTINFLGDDGSMLEDNNVRHGDTQWTLAQHQARVCNMADFYRAYPLDRNDIPKMLVNPVTGGDYMRNLMSAKNRRCDDIVYQAALANQLRKDGSTVALPAGQQIAAGGTGFTRAKLILAKKIFRRNEADEQTGEELYIAYDAEMLEDILTDTTLTSSDFMAVKMLQAGEVAGKWMGFNWIPYERLTTVSTTKTTIAWAKSGLHVGTGYVEGNVTRRADKKDTWQVSMGASFGAGRQDEKKVVRIDFTF